MLSGRQDQHHHDDAHHDGQHDQLDDHHSRLTHSSLLTRPPDVFAPAEEYSGSCELWSCVVLGRAMLRSVPWCLTVACSAILHCSSRCLETCHNAGCTYTGAHLQFIPEYVSTKSRSGVITYPSRCSRSNSWKLHTKSTHVVSIELHAGSDVGAFLPAPCP